MTLGQQRFHARLWMILGPALLAALILLVVLRPAAATGAKVSPEYTGSRR